MAPPLEMDVGFLSQQVESLTQQVEDFKRERAAFAAQREILEKLVSLARSPAQEEVLKITLQETLDIATNLSSADKGSLFLLDRSGVVSESILTQKEQTADIRKRLIGTVLDKGLAGWVQQHRTVGLITDTEHDDRWLTLPDQPYTARSALAVPILRGEELLGILTLLHSEPNRFNQQMADLMQMTADQIALVLENAALFGKLEESYHSLDREKQKVDAYSKALDSELDKGRQIQLDFLPSRLPNLPSWEIAACFHPARQVAGDFYDAFMLPGGKMGLVIADVCDKGVGAALFMALFRSLIRIFSGQAGLAGLSMVTDTCQDQLILEIDSDIAQDSEQVSALAAIPLVNNYVADEHGMMAMFATVFFGVLNPQTGLLTYINGGHEPLFMMNSQGICNQLEPTGPAVGMMSHRKFKIRQTHLKLNDILFGYTDGVTDVHSPAGELYTTQRLKDMIQKLNATSANELLKGCEAELFSYMQDAQQFDDITMLAVRRLE
jgi:phosphoserine phosphatase RsbU/P